MQNVATVMHTNAVIAAKVGWFESVGALSTASKPFGRSGSKIDRFLNALIRSDYCIDQFIASRFGHLIGLFMF